VAQVRIARQTLVLAAITKPRLAFGSLRRLLAHGRVQRPPPQRLLACVALSTKAFSTLSPVSAGITFWRSGRPRARSSALAGVNAQPADCQRVYRQNAAVELLAFCGGHKNAWRPALGRRPKVRLSMMAAVGCAYFRPPQRRRMNAQGPQPSLESSRASAIVASAGRRSPRRAIGRIVELRSTQPA